MPMRCALREQAIVRFLAARDPTLKVKRMLFSGQMLRGAGPRMPARPPPRAQPGTRSEDHTISSYDITKETMVIVMAEKKSEDGA
jgi:hypothetical protein